MKVKKGDKVVVLAGRDRGKEGDVTRTMPKLSAVLVEGVNVVKRHTKATQRTRAAILDVPQPIQSGKVAVICPHCKKPTRVGIRINGKVKERFCRKCQGVLK